MKKLRLRESAILTESESLQSLLDWMCVADTLSRVPFSCVLTHLQQSYVTWTLLAVLQSWEAVNQPVKATYCFHPKR